MVKDFVGVGDRETIPPVGVLVLPYLRDMLAGGACPRPLLGSGPYQRRVVYAARALKRAQSELLPLELGVQEPG
jgi:hypothetical protein